MRLHLDKERDAPPALRKYAELLHAHSSVALALFAGAMVSSRARGSMDAALASSIHHDDEYQPAMRFNSTDDDKMGNATSPGGEDKTVGAQTQQGDNIDHSWADATIEIDLMKYKYVAQYLNDKGVDDSSPSAA